MTTTQKIKRWLRGVFFRRYINLLTIKQLEKRGIKPVFSYSVFFINGDKTPFMKNKIRNKFKRFIE